jgi:deoxyribose-phosphate aldolase
MEEETKQFDFCNKVDLHALDFTAPLQNVVAIAGEHSFRGIVVTMSALEDLLKEIHRPTFGDKRIIPIAAIDYPFGSSSLDVRAYAVHSAHEKGAREIEIVAPYKLIAERNFRRLYDDAQTIMNAAHKIGIAVKYVVDQNSPYIDDGVRTKLCRIITSVRAPIISTSLGFFDREIDHSDSVLKMRNIKNKTGCDIKAFINPEDVNEFAMYVKAGADIIGLPWKKAVETVCNYQDIMEKDLKSE